MERYEQTHDPFNEDGTTKYSLSYAMRHFRNAVPYTSSGQASVSVGTMHTCPERRTVQLGAQIGSIHNRWPRDQGRANQLEIEGLRISTMKPKALDGWNCFCI